MDVKAGGIRGQARGKFRQFVGRESGFDFVFGAVEAAVIFAPVLGELAQRGLVLDDCRLFSARFEFRLDGGSLGCGVGRADVVGVDFASGGWSLIFL